ncbi:hypothetical protein ACTU44_21840 (plasmid) [Thalassospira sp. SM2505]
MKYVALAALALAASSLPASAGMEVIDPTSIIQEAKTTGEIAKNGSYLQEQISQGKEMLENIGDVKSVGVDVLGNIGNLTNAANGALNACGIGGFIPDLPGLSIDLPDLPDLSCLTESLGFVQEALYASHTIGARFGLSKGNGSSGDIRLSSEDIVAAKANGSWSAIKSAVIVNRENAHREMVERSLAAAYQGRTNAPKSAQILDLQKTFATDADDYGAMIQLMSAQLRGITEELASMRVLMAMQLGMEATKEVQSIPVENTVDGKSDSSNPLEAASNFVKFQ